MKTIQIPMNSNPFTVVINNSVYQYKAGELIEVPDEVAEAIEDALKLEPKPKRYPGRLALLVDGSLSELTAEDLDGITTLSGFAFYGCKSLKKATIPNGIKQIGKNAFDWCLNLESVYLPETPPVLEDITAIQNIKATCVFYCKTQKSVNAYKSAAIWSTLTGTYAFVVEE